MLRWFLVTLLLVALANGQKNSSLRFSKTKSELADCIENHELFKENDNYKDTGIGKAMANLAGERFSGTKNTDHIETEIEELINELLSRRYSVQYRQIPWDELQADTETALIDCSDNVTSISSTPDLQVIRRAVPRFLGETFEIADVLDYMLVDWSVPLISILHSRSFRIMMRRYADIGHMLLECAFVSLDNRFDLFRVLLRSAWMRRAGIYYDGRSSRLPYIFHRYTRDYMAPHTFGNISVFEHRSSENFTVRNPLVSREDLDRILNIHAADRDGYEGEYDIFDEYDRVGMTSAEYYIERHINQFYRIMFFFVELRARRIITDSRDVFEGPLPYDVVPEEIQAILYNDTAYREYLLSRRQDVLNLGYSDSIVMMSLNQTARVVEENLLSVLDSRIINFILRRSQINTLTTTSTTTTEKSVSTPKPNGKGNICRSFRGKLLSDSSGTTFPSTCCQYGSSRSRNSNKAVESCLQKQFEYSVTDSRDKAFMVCSMMLKVKKLSMEKTGRNYGYVKLDGIVDESLFPSKDTSRLIVSSLGSMFSGSDIQYVKL